MSLAVAATLLMPFSSVRWSLEDPFALQVALAGAALAFTHWHPGGGGVRCNGALAGFFP